MNVLRLATIGLVLCSAALQAAPTKPDCERLQQWASAYDASDLWQATPHVRLPGIARDEAVIPVFGESVTAWSRDDFANLTRWTRECSQIADRTSARALSTAGRAVTRMAGNVQRIQQMRAQAGQAVDAIASAPASAGKQQATQLAQAALQGDSIRRNLGSVPREFHGPLRTLSNVPALLTDADVHALTNRLTGSEVAAQAGEQDPDGGGTAEQVTGSNADPNPAPQRSAASRHRTATTEPEPAAEPQAATATDLEVPPPSLKGADSVRRVRLTGIYLGMPLEAAVEAGKQAGFRVKSRRGSTRKLGPVMQYWVDGVELEKGEIEPFPGGNMTREEAHAYQTRIAVQSVQSGTVSLVAYKGRVGTINVSASTFEPPDAVKAYVVEQLGTPDKESGASGFWWDMRWFQDPDKQGRGDTHIRIYIKQTQYTDRIRNTNVPYTQVQYSALLCQTLPECMGR